MKFTRENWTDMAVYAGAMTIAIAAGLLMGMIFGMLLRAALGIN